MKVKKLGKPVVKGKQVRAGTLTPERKLYQQEVERLDREIPLAGEKVRGLVFRR